MKLSAPEIRDRLLPITLGQFVGLLCGLGGVKLATRLVSPGDYGAYGVFMSFTPLGMWLVHAGLIKFTARHWALSPDRGALLREIIRAGLRKLPWLLIATLAASLAMHHAGFLAHWPMLFLPAALLSLGLLAQNAFMAERAHWTDFTLSSAASLSRSFGPPLLYFALGGSLFALELGFLAHAAVFATGCLYLLRKYKPARDHAPAQLSPVYDGPLFIVLSLSGWLLTAVNRWIMAGCFGTEPAGYFTLAGNLTQIATSMAGVMFVQYFQPGIFASASEEAEPRRKLARRVDLIAAGYCAFALAGVSALAWIAPYLVGPLISENYRPALGMLLPAGFFGAAIFTAQFYHTLLLAGHREKACGPVDLGTMLVLAGGGLIAALVGERWFYFWLLASPVVPWLLTRPLARHRYFKPAAAPAPSPVR